MYKEFLMTAEHAVLLKWKKLHSQKKCHYFKLNYIKSIRFK